jgi:hypothetical protein
MFKKSEIPRLIVNLMKSPVLFSRLHGNSLDRAYYVKVVEMGGDHEDCLFGLKHAETLGWIRPNYHLKAYELTELGQTIT